MNTQHSFVVDKDSSLAELYTDAHLQAILPELTATPLTLKVHEKEPFSAQSTTRNPQSEKASLASFKEKLQFCFRQSERVYSCSVKV